jgi:hypothetical protein
MDPLAASRKGSSRGIVLLLLASGMLLPCLFLPRYLRAKQSAQWPQAKGVITVSRLEVSYYRQRKAFRALIQYRYRVGDTSYSSAQLSFNKYHAAPSAAWQGVLDTYPVGKPVDVFYDPQNPAFAILEPGLNEGLGFAYHMVLFFIASFAAAFLIALYKIREPANR